MKYQLIISHEGEELARVEASKYDIFLEKLGSLERNQVLPCDYCNGTGRLEDDICHKCGGKGQATLSDIYPELQPFIIKK